MKKFNLIIGAHVVPDKEIALAAYVADADGRVRNVRPIFLFSGGVQPMTEKPAPAILRGNLIREEVLEPCQDMDMVAHWMRDVLEWLMLFVGVPEDGNNVVVANSTGRRNADLHSVTIVGDDREGVLSTLIAPSEGPHWRDRYDKLEDWWPGDEPDSPALARRFRSLLQPTVEVPTVAAAINAMDYISAKEIWGMPLVA